MQPDQHVALIGAGSRDGDRLARMGAAARALDRPGLCVRRVSSLYETEPVSLPGDRTLYNGVLEVATALGPAALMDACLEVERAAGRTRGRDASRPIDLDLLLYEDRIVSGPGLEIPHPRLHERRFVLEPLAEIAPGARHPRLGRTAAELLAACPDRAEVRRILPPGAWFEVPGRFR